MCEAVNELLRSILEGHHSSRGWRLTVGVTRKWAGVDSVWEQEKLEASLSWRTVQGKRSKSRAVPTSPVHAVLGMGLEESTLWHSNA